LPPVGWSVGTEISFANYFARVNIYFANYFALVYIAAMTPNQVIKFYGSETDAAKALRVTRQAVNYWKMKGRIPAVMQAWIEIQLDGKLKADRNAR